MSERTYIDANGEERPSIEQWTLGQLINALEKLDLTARVSFSFCGFAPTTWASARWRYSDLAIGYKDAGTSPTVAEFLASCRNCIGMEFEGWKGGEYVMGEDTPLWVANEGRGGDGTAIVGLTVLASGEVLIETAGGM